MEERRYTLKELYEYATEYSREAREEGFDMSVGDFVDWVAAQDIDQDDEDTRLIRESAERINLTDDEALDLVEQVRQEVRASNRLSQTAGNGTVFVDPHIHKTTDGSEQQDRPVLPEKLGIHSSWDVSNLDTLLDILLDTQGAVNTIIDYLAAREKERDSEVECKHKWTEMHPRTSRITGDYRVCTLCKRIEILSGGA